MIFIYILIMSDFNILCNFGLTVPNIKNITICGVSSYSLMINNNGTLLQAELPQNKSTQFLEYIISDDIWHIEPIDIISNTSSYHYIIFRITPINIFKSATSGALVQNAFRNEPIFNVKSLDELCWIPQFNETSNPDVRTIIKNKLKDIKVVLNNYQINNINKMYNIETIGSTYQIELTRELEINKKKYSYNPLTERITENQEYLNLCAKGGILSDVMGLGKTISCIGLIASNPSEQIGMRYVNNRICTKATLIICPAHLCDQWAREVEKCFENKFKVLQIISKTQFEKVNIKSFMDADIVIVPHSFITNFKYYPTINYENCTASSFRFNSRDISIKAFMRKNILEEKNMDKILNLYHPLFEYFQWNRLIVDESHEIFAGTSLIPRATLHYLCEWVTSINANYYWYVSGSPFATLKGLKNCANFIRLKFYKEATTTSEKFEFDFNNTNNVSQLDEMVNGAYYGNHDRRDLEKSYLTKFMMKGYIWDAILDKVAIRHRKEDVEEQVKIFGYDEKLIWLKFTDLETRLYQSKDKYNRELLQKLCCHPMICESDDKIIGDDVDLETMGEKYITYHKDQITSYEQKVSKLNISSKEYHMLKKKYDEIVSTSKYTLSILDKMKNIEELSKENCIVCLDNITNPAMTSCGHIYCLDCIKMCLSSNPKCPICKTIIAGKDLIIKDKKVDTEETNPMIKKYGSKLGKLISIIKFLCTIDETRIIIFSQWDQMLNLVGKTLSANGIENSFVRGPVSVKNSALRKFRNGITSEGVPNKVIMLSLKNAASGTNLTEATHIFFIEPIDSPKKVINTIESQAIARACRIGQTGKIMVVRILMANTIEEEIYKRGYNKDVNVDVEASFKTDDMSNEIFSNLIIKREVIEKSIKKRVEKKPKKKIINKNEFSSDEIDN